MVTAGHHRGQGVAGRGEGLAKRFQGVVGRGGSHAGRAQGVARHGLFSGQTNCKGVCDFIVLFGWRFWPDLMSFYNSLENIWSRLVVAWVFLVVVFRAKNIAKAFATFLFRLGGVWWAPWKTFWGSRGGLALGTISGPERTCVQICVVLDVAKPFTMHCVPVNCAGPGPLRQVVLVDFLPGTVCL